MTAEQQQQLFHRVVWFEIPTSDFQRATTFYQSIFDIQMQATEFGGAPMAVFPYQPPAVSGSLVPARDGAPPPGAGGPLLFLNAGPSLPAVLARVEPAGGQILTPSTELPAGMGCFAVIRDTEGNAVGLHAIS